MSFFWKNKKATPELILFRHDCTFIILFELSFRI